MSGIAFWITGLSGSGKTTVGKELYRRIREIKPDVVLLDGDRLRDVFGNDLGYTRDDRLKSAERNAKLMHLLTSQDIDTVCCTISMFDSIREWNRINNKRYLEVYLKVPMNILYERNQRNLYEKNSDELVGVGIEMEEPKNSDLEFVNDGSISVEKIVDTILDKVGYLK